MDAEAVVGILHRRTLSAAIDPMRPWPPRPHPL
jgi:hypothetical protein